MGCSLYVSAYAGKDSAEFKRHFGAVEFCIENDLSFPVETFEYFKGQVEGGDLDDYDNDYIIELLSNGISVDMPVIDVNECEKRIKVSDIPEGTDEIVFTLS